MPCMSDTPDERMAFMSMDLQFVTAIACMALTVIERNNLMDQLDCAEAGVKIEKVEDWWLQHKRDDQSRRKAEAKKREDAIKRKAALSKLSEADRELLGL